MEENLPADSDTDFNLEELTWISKYHKDILKIVLWFHYKWILENNKINFYTFLKWIYHCDK